MVQAQTHSGTTTAPRTIVITGASSGIGAALALAHARAGVHLGLLARNAERLNAVAAQCRAHKATVDVATLDVGNRAGMEAWLHDFDQRHPVERLIANAGVSGGTASGDGREPARAIFAVNLDGVLNTVLPLIPAMVARRQGQIALMSSLAGFRGFPGAPAYCGSKAAVRVWGEGLRGDLARHGVAVSVICPGFVRSPMTAVNRFPMPFQLDSTQAAARIQRGLDRDQGRIAFPWPTYAAVWLLSLLPSRLADTLLARTPRKSNGEAR